MEWLFVGRKMNKLIVDVLGIEKLSKYKVDGIIINSIDYSIFSNTKFNYEEIEKINNFCKVNKVLSIVAIDKIFSENDLNNLTVFIEKLEKINIDYYIFSDLAIIDIFNKKKLLKKLIYKPNTLVTNYLDAEFLNNMGLNFFVSNEISLEDISQISSKTNLSIEIYGYHPIFYSKRRSLRNFSEYLNNIEIVNKTKYLKEELREELYPIYEYNDVSIIYSSERIALTKELESIINVNFYKINGDFLSEEEIFKIIDFYRNYFKSEIDLNELKDSLISINPNVNNPFLYKKTCLTQTGEKNEKN